MEKKVDKESEGDDKDDKKGDEGGVLIPVIGEKGGKGIVEGV